MQEAHNHGHERPELEKTNWCLILVPCPSFHSKFLVLVPYPSSMTFIIY
jgi:hypothetical protein